MDNIILIGMPGSGKSSVGVVLAKALGLRFLDVERDVICSIDCRGTVIAPGGSCVCREASIAHMRRLGTVVYLQLPLEDAIRRVRNLSTRGVALSPGQTLADVFQFRAPLYERCAHITVPVRGQSLTETVEAVKTALRSDGQKPAQLWRSNQTEEDVEM